MLLAWWGGTEPLATAVGWVGTALACLSDQRGHTYSGIWMLIMGFHIRYCKTWAANAVSATLESSIPVWVTQVTILAACHVLHSLQSGDLCLGDANEKAVAVIKLLQKHAPNYKQYSTEGCCCWVYRQPIIYYIIGRRNKCTSFSPRKKWERRNDDSQCSRSNPNSWNTSPSQSHWDNPVLTYPTRVKWDSGLVTADTAVVWQHRPVSSFCQHAISQYPVPG